jgi:uncharacterized protein with FMN-binding domain
MRRAVIAVAGTAAGLIGILGYRSGPTPSRGRSASPSGGSAVAGPTPTEVPPTSEPTTVPTTVPTTTPSTTPPPTTAAPTGTGSFVGQDFPTEYGDVQVRVVYRNGRITDVQAVLLPNDRPRSAEISNVAGPQLRDEVLLAQSAKIDAVSGATYTSVSYALSVQSAIDQANG